MMSRIYWCCFSLLLLVIVTVCLDSQTFSLVILKLKYLQAC